MGRSFKCTQIAFQALLGAILTVAGTTVSAGVFQIDALTADNATVIDHNGVTGDDDGGIAISNSQVFYDGDSGTGRFDINNLSGGTNIGTRRHAMVSDIATGDLYVFGTDSSTELAEGGAGPVTHLLELNGATGALTGSSIALSSPVPTPGGSGFFAGHERVLIWDGSAAYSIALPSGSVTNLGTVALSSPRITEVNRFWGVAEFNGTDVSLVYVNSNSTDIQRTNVSTGATTVAANFPAGLSDMGAFTVSIASGRWYFHHESNSGTFGGTNETLGFADASFSTTATSSQVPVPALPLWALLLLMLGVVGVGVGHKRYHTQRA